MKGIVMAPVIDVRHDVALVNIITKRLCNCEYVGKCDALFDTAIDVLDLMRAYDVSHGRAMTKEQVTILVADLVHGVTQNLHQHGIPHMEHIAFDVVIVDE